MANRFRGEIDFVFEGTKYRLRLDMNVMASFEALTGKNALDLFEQVEEGAEDARTLPTISEMRAMLFCALERDHPDATLELAGDMMSEDQQLLFRLIDAAAPDVPKARAGNAKGNPRKPARKAG